MATKNEKVFGTLAGTAIGFILANWHAKNNGLTGIEKMRCQFMGVASGGLAGYSISNIFGSPNDTVNYFLQNKNDNKVEHVYDGITYEHRINRRMYEHLKDGKIFTEMIYDTPKPRIEALKLEKKLVLENKGIYNKQHNS
ncbi:hypothetical protein [uncultured Kordia sp.]|uniref:hypothetical protein n=1 Tax=uncultured Kordia sp. TaxID=507699 RepID=UPI00261B3E4A|nr:hypothetical protein [uncultured Kordia sp.]